MAVIEQIGAALIANGPIGILCLVLWLQAREQTKREDARIEREDERNQRNEIISRERIAADLEMAKGLVGLTREIERLGK